MKQTRKIKVEPHWLPAKCYLGGQETQVSQIRLKGKWLSAIFPPNTHIQVSIITGARGEIGLRLEPLMQGADMANT